MQRRGSRGRSSLLAGHRRASSGSRSAARRSACRIYAIGSNRLAAFRSGVPVGRTKIVAYAIGGLFSRVGRAGAHHGTGIGAPVPGPYTLHSVAAVVLGGVSLAGGRGGLVGPIVAVLILASSAPT